MLSSAVSPPLRCCALVRQAPSGSPGSMVYPGRQTGVPASPRRVPGACSADPRRRADDGVQERDDRTCRTGETVHHRGFRDCPLSRCCIPGQRLLRSRPASHWERRIDMRRSFLAIHAAHDAQARSVWSGPSQVWLIRLGTAAMASPPLPIGRDHACLTRCSRPRAAPAISAMPPRIGRPDVSIRDVLRRA